MIIKGLKIKSFEEMDRFEAAFNDCLNLVCGKQAEAVMRALGMVLKVRSVTAKSDWIRGPGSWLAESKKQKESVMVGDGFCVRKPVLERNTELETEILLDGKVFRIRAERKEDGIGFAYHLSGPEDPESVFRALHRSWEEECIGIFKADDSKRFASCLKHYRNQQWYYPEGVLARRTDGTGATRAFRVMLMDYIRNDVPERLSGEKPYWMKMEKDGSFRVFHEAAPEEECCLSESDEMFFHYRCFLKVTKFWTQMQNLRDMNHVVWPLFISGLAGRLDSREDLSGLLQRTRALNRQILLFERGDDAPALSRLKQEWPCLNV